MTNIQWQLNICDMLDMSFRVTMKIQLEDLTPGYSYRKWSGLVLQLENNGGLNAKAICDEARD
jgi:hypothetical protein